MRQLAPPHGRLGQSQITARARHAGGHCHLAKLRGATPPPQAGEAPTSRHPHFGLKPWEKLPPAAATPGNTQGSARTDPRHKETRRQIRSGHRACKPEAQHEMCERSRSGAGEGPLGVQLRWSRAEPSRTEQSRTLPSGAESSRVTRVWLVRGGSDRMVPSRAELGRVELLEGAKGRGKVTRRPLLDTEPAAGLCRS